MPADVTKARLFNLTTDFPLDKVVYISSGSFTMGGATSGLYSFPHNLLFKPLCSGSWSLTPDFSVQYEFGSGTFPSENIFISPFNQVLSLSDNFFGNAGGADVTNVSIAWQNSSASSVTVYYRVFGFGPPDEDYIASPTADAGDEFVLNTDYNYTKLYINSAQSISAGNTYSIPYNGGNTPQVAVWFNRTSDGKIIPYDTENVISSGYFYTVSISSLSLTVSTESPTIVNKLYNRIYLDDN